MVSGVVSCLFASSERLENVARDVFNDKEMFLKTTERYGAVVSIDIHLKRTF